MTKLPLNRSARSTLLWTLLFALMPIASLTPFGLWVLAFMLLLGNCALCTAFLSGGILPGALGFVLSVLSLGLMMGPLAALLGGVYLGVTTLAFLVLYLKKASFWHAAAALITCQFLSALGIFLYLYLTVGNTLFQAAGQSVVNMVKNSDLCDTLLLSLYQTGLITLDSATENAMFVQDLLTYALSDIAREEMLLGLGELVRSMLESMVPNLLIGHSIETGVLCAAWPLHAAARKQHRLNVQEVPDEKNPPVYDLGMPPIRDWHIPRPWGLRIGLLGLGYFLSLFAQNAAFALLGQMFYSLFAAVFTIQGVATLNFVQHKRGTKYGWRVALPIIFTFLMPNALVILGLMDQVTNMRMLRPLPEGREYPFMPDKSEEEDEDEDEDNEDNGTFF